MKRDFNFINILPIITICYQSELNNQSCYDNARFIVSSKETLK